MSREYLTLTQAGEKLQRNLSGVDFITKQQALSAGADEIPLQAYRDFDYPVDNDITGLPTGTKKFTIHINTVGVPSNTDYILAGWIGFTYLP